MTDEFLLVWLSKEESSAYGECRGEALDRLIAKGFAEVGPTPPGRDKNYARVRLTDAGREALPEAESL
ncbi:MULTISPECIES: hypothetical protein [Hyphomicrobiales]|uniref:hypothetical protein n=1 Tax=Hyphomicrobiales TaxID=356 RepID=UPI000F680CC0|nr:MULTISPECIES: hypothetical protein [Hyphomicrobiales]MCQ9147324.1 hypothetical protein [Ochrobactrum sp. BTU2]MDH1271546.1 hypothetical protein [Agrobacterium pusense]MDX4076705.1 hypothetical protein [Brucella sp. NBRC 113783]RSC24715.1 hypothetical protein EGT36_28210 [Agrobacterium sp. FDAARGOS_525]